LQQYSINNNQGGGQSAINLANWPNLNLTFEGANGSPVTLTITPGNYWQFDAIQQGMAIANMYGDGGQMGGQSILGLPLFNGYFVVFDRTALNGHGVINFAQRT
jgi:hypothetical protein